MCVRARMTEEIRKANRDHDGGGSYLVEFNDVVRSFFGEQQWHAGECVALK